MFLSFSLALPSPLSKISKHVPGWRLKKKESSSPNLWFGDWGNSSKSYVYIETLLVPFMSPTQGSKICFEITEHLLISWFSTKQWPEVKPLHAHNILLKDDLIWFHVHLPVREYHSEYRGGREEERLPERKFSANTWRLHEPDTPCSVKGPGAWRQNDS